MTNLAVPEAAPLAERARDWVFRLVYGQQLSDGETDEVLAAAAAAFVVDDAAWATGATNSPYLPDPRAGRIAEESWDRHAEAIKTALTAIAENRSKLEEAVQKASPRWRLDRMPGVDRALLIVGCYELIVRRATPARRIINRTVELAKRYGAPETKRFVNGILDQIRKDNGIEAD
jgi:transcription antitermination factor NusB